MLFHSLEFVVFFPVVVLIYFALPARVKNHWLLFASYIFYMSWNPKYGILLFACTLVTWAGALLLERVRNNKRQYMIFISVLVIVFGVLIYYKYMNFLLTNIELLLSFMGAKMTVPKFDIVLPVGISFFTFQAAGYFIDVYRGEIYAERNFWRYALFISFFPQLIAGPIERSKNLLKQLDKEYSFDYMRVRRGLLIMLWGFFLKLVIADRCAILVDTVFGKIQNYSGFPLVLAAFLFSVQIYCDFMGYSTIARGAACVIGYQLMENFHQPYLAVSMQDFWRRWHISLSTWFRDYLYIPLGGSRAGVLRRYLNLMVTFLVSGLWHGANWTYVLWGGTHGVLLVLEDIANPLVKRLGEQWNVELSSISFRLMMVIKTFFLTTVAWVFFRVPRFSDAILFFRRCVLGSNVSIFKLGLDQWEFTVLGIGLLVLITHSLMREGEIATLTWITDKKAYVRYTAYWTLVMMIILSLDLGGKEFIYFQF